MFDPDGAHAATDRTRSITSLETGWLVNPRTARRLVTASLMSMIACLSSCRELPGGFGMSGCCLCAVEPFVEADATKARFAQRHQRVLLDPAAEVSGLGIAHDLT